MHYGVLGMKWGVRRYQNEDGSLTEAGKRLRKLNGEAFLAADRIRNQKRRLANFQDNPYRVDRFNRGSADDDDYINIGTVGNFLTKTLASLSETAADSLSSISYDNDGDGYESDGDMLKNTFFRGLDAVERITNNIGNTRVNGSEMSRLVDEAADRIFDLYRITERYDDDD